MNKLLMIALVLTSSTIFAGESKKPDAVAVDNACTEEAKTANCGEEKVGTGLLKCLHAYKKDHKDFKPSEGCKTALKQLREDHKNNKK